MRLPQTLLAARLPQGEYVPFQPLLPMQLKNAVSGKGNKANNVCCIQEMTIMLACLKTSEFDQQPCSKEIGNFQKCYTNHLETMAIREEQENKGILVAGEKKMGFKQLNKILRKFPSPTRSY